MITKSTLKLDKKMFRLLKIYANLNGREAKIMAISKDFVAESVCRKHAKLTNNLRGETLVTFFLKVGVVK